MKPLDKLRDLSKTGLQPYSEAWDLARSATSELPADPRIEALQYMLVELLQIIEMELVLGSNAEPFKMQLSALIDWIEKQT